MINWFEKHNKTSWTITILIAISIFVLSSINFGSGAGGGSSIYSTIYHFFAFFFLSGFLMISVMNGKGINSGRKEVWIISIMLAGLYGVLDELHQYFVPGRSSSMGDVTLDFGGVLIASMVYFLFLEYKTLNKERV